MEFIDFWNINPTYICYLINLTATISLIEIVFFHIVDP